MITYIPRPSPRPRCSYGLIDSCRTKWGRHSNHPNTNWENVAIDWNKPISVEHMVAGQWEWSGMVKKESVDIIWAEMLDVKQSTCSRI